MKKLMTKLLSDCIGGKCRKGQEGIIVNGCSVKNKRHFHADFRPSDLNETNEVDKWLHQNGWVCNNAARWEECICPILDEPTYHARDNLHSTANNWHCPVHGDQKREWLLHKVKQEGCVFCKTNSRDSSFYDEVMKILMNELYLAHTTDSGKTSRLTSAINRISALKDKV